jgi:hypothetical protein
MTRTLVLVLAALASLTVAASALGSASHPAASSPSLHVQPRTVRPNGAVHVFGHAGSCAAGSKLTALSSAFPEITFGVGGLTGRVRANHAFSIHGYVRGNVPAGKYSVTARCGGTDIGVAAKIKVG